MDVVVIGPGRAGGALGLASLDAGHRVVAVRPGPSGAVPVRLRPYAVDPRSPLPPADLLVVAVADDDIARVAETVVGGPFRVACHLSGYVPSGALAAVPAAQVGSLHPLMSIPDPDRGARLLSGAWAGVTGSGSEAEGLLADLARSLGMQPFPLDEEVRPAYHAGASAASNFLTAALGVAADLLTAAGVPFEAARRLSEASVANAFELGPAVALTGPAARGDLGTVRGQVEAADRAGVGDEFRLLTAATARRAGTFPGLRSLLEGG